MNALKTTRVVVIDDVIEEGTALLRAFSKLGVGAAYYTANPQELPAPEQRLKGVRLLATDMKLAAGISDDQALVQLLKVIPGIIHPENGPFILLGWTGRPDLVQKLKVHLAAKYPELRPVFATSLEKGNVLNTTRRALSTEVVAALDSLKDELGGEEMERSARTVLGQLEEAIRKQMPMESEANLDMVANELQTSIQKCLALNVMLNWEQQVHEAASDTTLTLAHVAAPASPSLDEKENSAGSDDKQADKAAQGQQGAVASAAIVDHQPEAVEKALPEVNEGDLKAALDKEQDWCSEMAYLLATLVREEGGKTLAGALAGYRALFDGLDPILQDQLDDKARTPGALAPEIEALLGSEAATTSRFRALDGLIVCRENERKAVQEQRDEKNQAAKSADLAPEERDALQKEGVRLNNKVSGLGSQIKELQTAQKALVRDLNRKKGALNRRILLAKVTEKPTPPASGNLYLEVQLDGEPKQELGLSSMGITKEELLKGVLEKEEAIKECLPVLIDTTPACDYAQGKTGLKRVVAGALVPARYKLNANMPDACQLLGVIGFDDGSDSSPKGLYRLVIHNSFTDGMQSGVLEPFTAAFRIRRHVLGAIQHWGSSHGSRPGYTVIHIAKPE
ncbi:MAG TPA: hypothetical protein VD973_25755 [Symbiobacteriaceae bacterium]|nr:hypothetical protein [Symbiobacteriaceae bacterium]